MKFTTSGCGGTDRRASLRSWRAQVRAGSNPAAPTIEERIAALEKENGGLSGVRARRAGRLGREDGGSGVYLQYGYMKFP